MDEGKLLKSRLPVFLHADPFFMLINSCAWVVWLYVHGLYGQPGRRRRFNVKKWASGQVALSTYPIADLSILHSPKQCLFKRQVHHTSLFLGWACPTCLATAPQPKCRARDLLENDVETCAREGKMAVPQVIKFRRDGLVTHSLFRERSDERGAWVSFPKKVVLIFLIN